MTFTQTPPSTPGFYAWKIKPDAKSIAVFHLKTEAEIRAQNSEPYGLWCKLVPAEEVEKAFREGYTAGDIGVRPREQEWQQSNARKVVEGL